ncbi:MAG: MCE family protein [Propionibacteriales bacterium]|nr:MCE family protein [Propionibacteriales bacterium]
MSKLLERLSGRLLAVVVAALLLTATFLLFTGGGEQRTLTAHFSRAVAIYKGSEMRLMGVRIGTVEAVVPEGDSVRVVMKYDAQYKLPVGAKAMIVTPTLVADRFVQISPAYTKGAVMQDGADIPLDQTASPVELDRIYKSLARLSDALGPNGANKTGALSDLITAGANALRGQGQLANETINNLSGAAEVFGNNSGALFSSVRQLSQLTEVLAANDRFVNQFMGDLAGVSSQLAGERDDLQGALAALARAVGTVRSFVHDNKGLVKSDIEDLTSVLGAVAKEKDALATAVQLAPLGLGNLTTAFDVKTGTIGARVQLGDACAQQLPCLMTPKSLGTVLCDVVVNSGQQNAATVCDLLKRITALLPDVGGAVSKAGNAGLPKATASQPTTFGQTKPSGSLISLLGGHG